MSGTGSPSDRNADQTATEIADALAGADAGQGVDSPVSGDANSQPPASSADSDQGANKDAKKPTLAEVIKTAAEQDNASGTSPAPAKDGKDNKVEGDGADTQAKADGEKAETDDSKLPFHNHPRWKEVIGQNKDLTTKVATLEPAAQQFGKIETFMQEHSLTHEEVGEGFIIMAMAKAGDPRVLQKLDDFRSKVALAIGEELPDDIKSQVESGAITDEAGKELARSRARLKVSETRDAARTEADQRRADQEQATTLANECKVAVTSWEEGIRKTDPDFAKKEKAVTRYAQAIMRERGFPKTKDDAVQIVKDAYAEVNSTFVSNLPQKQPVSRVPAAPSTNGAKTKPGSLLEAVTQAASK